MLGEIKTPNLGLSDLSFREMAVFAPLIAWAFSIGINPQPYFRILDRPVPQIVERVRPGYYAESATSPIPWNRRCAPSPGDSGLEGTAGDLVAGVKPVFATVSPSPYVSITINARGRTFIRQNCKSTRGEVMNRTLLTLAGLLLAGTVLPAQISIPTFAAAVTTGGVGLAASQTAQLNVVNLNSASTTTTTSTPTPACQVQLEFWDSKGILVKSSGPLNLLPGATGFLQIKLTDVTSNTSPLRTEVRGVVRRTTTAPPTGVTIPPGASVQPIFYPAYCAVATTLEVFDSTTGVTQALTSDLHTLEDFTIPPPLPALGR
jgi:hypothetical protein